MEGKIATKKVIVNSFIWKLLERVFSQGVNLVVQIVLARILMPSDFGSLAVIVVITNYAAIFVQSGLSTAIVQKKELTEKEVSTLLTASLFVAFLFFTLLYFISPWLATVYEMPHLTWPLRVLSLILFLNAINSVQTALLSRNMDFKSIFIRTAFAVPISGAIGIGMAYCGFGLWALVAHNLVNMLVLIVVMFIGTDYKLHLGFSLSVAKPLYKFSGNILLSNLVSGFSDTLRVLVIGKKYNANDLAYYDKAITYSNYVTHIVNAAMQSVMLPVFSRKQDDLRGLTSAVRKSSQMASFVMFPILTWIICCAKPLISILLTDKWLPCVPFLMIFCLMRIPGCITTLDKQAYYAVGRSDIGLYYESFLLIANIVALFLTLAYGVGMISVGVTIVEFVCTFAIFAISNRVYGYRLSSRLRDLFKPTFNSLIMAMLIMPISFFVTNNFYLLILQLLVGVFVYFTMSYISKDASFIYIKKQIKNNKK